MPTTTVYQGDLRCLSTADDAAGEVVTDGPSRYGGRGEQAGPLHLLAMALGSCILTTVAVVARRLDIDLLGSSVDVDYELAADSPKRVIRFAVTVRIPREVGDVDRARLERAVHACPVGNSLHPDIDETISFIYG